MRRGNCWCTGYGSAGEQPERCTSPEVDPRNKVPRVARSAARGFLFGGGSILAQAQNSGGLGAEPPRDEGHGEKGPYDTLPRYV